MRVAVVVVVVVECVMIGVTQYVPLSFHTLTFFLVTLVDEQLGLLMTRFLLPLTL